MIRNEREYRITRAQAEKFRAAIASSHGAPAPKGVHPRLRQASIEGMRAQLVDLEHELRTYEALKAGGPKTKLAGTWNDLGVLLVQARIARGWTQRELGDRLGLHMQKIQQYEATEYASASLTRVLDVARALGLTARVQVELVEMPASLELSADAPSRSTAVRSRRAAG